MKDLSENKFFQEWKKASVFEHLLSSPKILVEEFSEKWISDLKKIIGDGPMTSRFLASLAMQIEKIRFLEGYSNIKKRLLRLDEQLHPTFVEIDFIWFLLLNTSPDKIHLEYTFKTPSGKHPELKVDDISGPVYFEVTSVENFRQMNLILRYYNILTAFQLSLSILYGIKRKIKIKFLKYPDEKIFIHMYKTLNEFAAMKKFVFTQSNRDYEISMTEGETVKFEMPIKTFENKIKDKIEEKAVKFEDNERNYVVIDITSMVVDMSVLLERIREYFEYSGNKTIWGVLLMSKGWVFKEMNIEWRFEAFCQANSCIEGKEPFNTISRFIPNSGYLSI